MRCKQCGSEVADGSKYCNFCGSKVDESVNIGILRKKLAEVKVELSKSDNSFDKRYTVKKIDASLNIISTYLQNSRYAEESNELLDIKEQFIQCRDVIQERTGCKQVEKSNTNIVAKLFILLGAIGILSAAVAVFYVN